MSFLRNRVASLALGAAMLVGSLAPATAQQFLRLATLGPGSSPYMVMSTFAQIVNEALPDVEIQVNATGAATQHALEAGAGQLDFFMWSASVHANMMAGTAMYANVPQAPELSQHLRAVFAFPLGVYHITTFADSGIMSLDDLRGKTVFLGPPGGGATAIMQNVVRAATGMEPGTDYEQVQLGWDAAAQAFQDGRIDVYVNSTLVPSPVIQQIALTRQIRFLGLTPEQMALPAMQRILNRPGGLLGEIPARAYGDNQVNTEAVQTLGSTVGIGVGEHVDADTVYRVTKAFWEGAAAMRDTTPWLRQVTIEDALRDLNLPLHPGAARYYREIGVTIPPEIDPGE